MNTSIVPSAGVAGPHRGEIYTLRTSDSRIEVWPFLGFNCLHWEILQDALTQPLLYCAADWATNPVPTRSGHPILFPFPNRLRHGRFKFEGRDYQLPLTDSTGQHAIHGYTPRAAWRVIDAGTSPDHAWITGEFQLTRDLPSASASWPADARTRVTYRLFTDRLRVETVIDAADGRSMPFGLGFHPYFQMDGPLSGWQLRMSAGLQWELVDNFPTGTTIRESPAMQFHNFKPLGDFVFDSLFGDVPTKKPMAELRSDRGRLTVDADASFRELLLFTPPHRQAIAIEPYTCISDAANLQTDGIDAGWRVLPSGETYSATVEYRYTAMV